ncbi:MAG: hypothetical protein ABH833_00635 [Parcubacteria group bacterium]
MYIDPNSWHAKLFFMCLSIWSKFKTGDKRIPRRYERGTNLCFYVRTITVWAPLVILLHLAFVVATVWTFTLLPISLFGFLGFAKTGGYIIVLCLLATGIVYGINLAGPRVKEVGESINRRTQPTVDNAVEKGSSAIEVAVEWFKARKQQICPFISFQGGAS